MKDIIWNLILDCKEELIGANEATNTIFSIFNNDGVLAITFAEWIGTNYEHDEGSVIGNVYYDKITRKDYNITELWNIFSKKE